MLEITTAYVLTPATAAAPTSQWRWGYRLKRISDTIRSGSMARRPSALASHGAHTLEPENMQSPADSWSSTDVLQFKASNAPWRWQKPPRGPCMSALLLAGEQPAFPPEMHDMNPLYAATKKRMNSQMGMRPPSGKWEVSLSSQNFVYALCSGFASQGGHQSMLRYARVLLSHTITSHHWLWPGAKQEPPDDDPAAAGADDPRLQAFQGGDAAAETDYEDPSAQQVLYLKEAGSSGSMSLSSGLPFHTCWQCLVSVTCAH